MNILVGLIEHIGDIIACEPVARYLKSKHPNCKISWVVNEKYRALIDSNPYIDNTIIVNCLTEWMILSAHESYDYVFDLHVNYRTCEHCQIPLIKKVGNPSVNTSEWFDYGSILEAFSQGAGLPRLKTSPQVYPQPNDFATIASLNLSQKYCVIHRTSSSIEKDWHDSKWKIISAFIRKSGLQIVEIGSGGPSLHSGLSKSYLNLIGKTTLLETAALIKGAALFIGIDSAPAHMANANRTPGVILLGQYKKFKKYNPFSGFYANQSPLVKVIQNPSGAAQEITTDEVIEAISYIISSSDISNNTIATESNDFEDDYIPTTKPQQKDEVKALAFYLPQFHPITENNLAHTPGFTEWTNVIKTKPLFPGHYQPKQPGELGYYDLRSTEVISQQVSLAIQYGLSGFCFYYYYFAGKKLLYSPIKKFIDSQIEFPFCFMWANENWSKRWDGGNKEVIISQVHSPDDDRIFIRELIATFNDNRYIKIDEKPLLIIYKAHLFNDIQTSTKIWREEASQHGLKGLYLVLADDWTNLSHPKDFGFDASYEIPSNLLSSVYDIENKDFYQTSSDFQGRLVDYYKFSSALATRPFPEYKRFKTVMAPWDNTARYGNKSQIYLNSDNDSYLNWFTKAYLDTHQQFPPSERIMFVHSWNEWCEGTYIEPDGKKGRFYLEQTLAAINAAKSIIALGSKYNVPLEPLLELNKIDRKSQGFYGLMVKAESQRILNSIHPLHKIYAKIPRAIKPAVRTVWRSLKSLKKFST